MPIDRRGALAAPALLFGRPGVAAPARAQMTSHWIVNEGLRLRVWCIATPGSTPRPAILWNHGSQMARTPDGNFLDVSARSVVRLDGVPWRMMAIALGVVIVIPEGRGYGASEGPKPLEAISNPRTIVPFLKGRARDAVAATVWAAAQQEIDPTRIAIAGFSHGGLVAMLAGTMHDYAASIAQCSGVAFHAEEIGFADMRQAAATGAGPLLVQHMLTDSIIPASVSRAIHEAASQAGRRSDYHEYAGVPGLDGHAMWEPANRAQWFADFNAFLTEAFRPA